MSKFLNKADLKAAGITYSASQLQRKMKDGSFPLAVKGMGNELVWLEDEIDRYKQSLIASRSPPQRPRRAAA